MATPISARNYSATTLPTQIATNIDNQATTTNIPVVSTLGFPAVPFTGCLDRNTQNQEFVLVTATPDNAHFTVVRGYDGTPLSQHLTPATFEHTVGAIDYREANWHHTDTTRDDHLQYLLTSGARPSTGLQTFSGGISTPSIAGVAAYSGASAYSGLQTFNGGISTPSIAGTALFASIPSGPAADPTAVNQFTRKSYVDAKASAAQSAATSSAVSTAEAYTNANAMQWINNNGINEIQGGWVSVAAASNGLFTHTYAVAFTTATVLVVAGVGTSAQTTIWHVQVNSSSSRTGFSGRIGSTNVDSNPAAGNYTINFIAIGY